MAFIPSKLGVYNASRSFPVKWNNPGWGITGEYDYWSWGDDNTEEPLDVSIQDPSTSGCTIQFFSPTTITTDSSTVFHFFPRGMTTALLSEDLPVNLHSKSPGFYPKNNSINVPNTGGEYTVECILDRSDIIKWDASVVNATALVNMEVLDWDSCSIKFKFTVRANTQWNTDLTGTIQLGAYYESDKLISYSYNFKIAKNSIPSDLKLKITPSSTYIGASSQSSTFTITTTKPEEAIVNYSVTCPGVSDISQKPDGVFTVTFPENTTINSKLYIIYIEATTTGGHTLTAFANVTQRATNLSFPITSYEVGWSSGTLTITGTGSNNLDDVVYAIPVTWISNPKLTVSSGGIATLTLNIAENIGLGSRSATIGVSVIKEGSSIINIPINITQAVKSDITPIWKDYVWTEATTYDFIEYHLDYAGQMIYAGKAYKYPEAERVEFLLNSVAENYLSNSLIFPEKEQTMIIPEYLKSFTLITSSGNDKPITFFNDWSYKDRDLEKGTMLSDPITGLIDPRQYLMGSWILPTGEGVINRVMYVDGVQSVIDISLHSGINGYTYITNLSDYTLPCNSYIILAFAEGGNITDRQIRYNIDTTGKEYVLYYINAAGGWDSLLVEGNAKKTDEIKSETYVRRVLNTSNDFAKNKYLNTITASWTLFTGYLNDIQASKMYNLLESNTVYLHNLTENTITPVIITDNSCEYKTYTNQGKNKFYYTINVEASQDKYRK